MRSRAGLLAAILIAGIVWTAIRFDDSTDRAALELRSPGRDAPRESLELGDEAEGRARALPVGAIDESDDPARSTGTLSILCEDIRGVPVGDFPVRVESDAGVALARGRTDPGGRLQLTSLPSGKVAVRAPWCKRAFEQVMAGEVVECRLVLADGPAGGGLERVIVVRSQETGLGSVGADICVSTVPGNRSSTFQALGQTDHEGQYVLPHPGWCAVTASHPVHGISEVALVSASAARTVLTLERPGRLAVSLHRNDGVVPAGARVLLGPLRGAARDRIPEERLVAGHGEVEFAEVRPGWVRVRAIHDPGGSVATGEGHVLVEAGQTASCRVDLEAGGRVDLTVVSDDPEELEGVWIQVDGADSAYHRYEFLSGGRANLPVPAGRVDLVVGCDGFSTWESQLDVVSGAEIETRVVLEHLLVIEGRVTLDGLPVSGWLVRMKDLPGLQHNSPQLMTRPDGSFTLEVSEEQFGDGGLEVFGSDQAAGFPVVTTLARPGVFCEIDVRSQGLDRPGGIEVRVQDQDGRWVEGAQLLVTSSQGSTVSEPSLTDGWLLLPGLPDGEFDVSVQFRGRSWPLSKTVVSHAVVDLGIARLDPEGG